MGENSSGIINMLYIHLIFEFGKSTRLRGIVFICIICVIVIGFIVAVTTFTIAVTAVTKFTITVTTFTIAVTTRSYTTFLKTVVYVTSSSFTNEAIITI